MPPPKQSIVAKSLLIACCPDYTDMHRSLYDLCMKQSVEIWSQENSVQDIDTSVQVGENSTQKTDSGQNREDAKKATTPVEDFAVSRRVQRNEQLEELESALGSKKYHSIIVVLRGLACYDAGSDGNKEEILIVLKQLIDVQRRLRLSLSLVDSSGKMKILPISINGPESPDLRVIHGAFGLTLRLSANHSSITFHSDSSSITDHHQRPENSAPIVTNILNFHILSFDLTSLAHSTLLPTWRMDDPEISHKLDEQVQQTENPDHPAHIRSMSIGTITRAIKINLEECHNSSPKRVMEEARSLFRDHSRKFIDTMTASKEYQDWLDGSSSRFLVFKQTLTDRCNARQAWRYVTGLLCTKIQGIQEGAIALHFSCSNMPLNEGRIEYFLESLIVQLLQHLPVECRGSRIPKPSANFHVHFLGRLFRAIVSQFFSSRKIFILINSLYSVGKTNAGRFQKFLCTLKDTENGVFRFLLTPYIPYSLEEIKEEDPQVVLVNPIDSIVKPGPSTFRSDPTRAKRWKGTMEAHKKSEEASYESDESVWGEERPREGEVSKA
ncbi:hypothetical protein K491DRAFT_684433 [Lophiostoma macrostomum CBS 122681]|uniref:Uncharacterized protein n=1 Tax=Lophiostoma macrostomum CBS 122681 TaxID=1314788 RepID=A0A6A6SQV0_9PLEO|nr:hypothetical protein K491DRAFT_684433 [Lophiostoma macrostomum CBS 122681]